MNTGNAGSVYRCCRCTSEHRGEFCDTEVFRADCPDDHVIILTHARYGRMEIGRCVQMALGYVGCQSDVLLAADRRCSGRRSCDIRVPDAEFEATRPCLKELKTYLDVAFKCVRGSYSMRASRQLSGNFQYGDVFLTDFNRPWTFGRTS